MQLPPITNPTPVVEQTFGEVYATRWEILTPHNGTWSARVHYQPYDYATDTVREGGHRVMHIADLRAEAESDSDVAAACGALMVVLSKKLNAGS